jgi:hypothetical protein
VRAKPASSLSLDEAPLPHRAGHLIHPAPSGALLF